MLAAIGNPVLASHPADSIIVERKGSGSRSNSKERQETLKSFLTENELQRTRAREM